MDKYINTIIQGDCLEVMKELDPERIGVVLADPPYGKGYRSHHNNNPTGEFAKYRRDENFYPIVGDDEPYDPSPWLAWDGATKLILWGANYYADRLPAVNVWHVWDKLDGKTPAAMQGDCELAWTNLGGVTRIYHHLWRGLMRKGRENISRSPKLHPHQKPVALMKWQLAQCKLPDGAIVLEPYAGSASATVAAIEMGYRYIAIEIDAHWIPTIEKRIRNAERQRLLF